MFACFASMYARDEIMNKYFDLAGVYIFTTRLKESY